MAEIIELLIDIASDSLKSVPFLFAAYIFIEYTEHRASGRFIDKMTRLNKLSPALGALAGLFPQCGFLVSAVRLFTGGLISFGTLAAVFISTSDDAFPVLIGKPGGIITIIALVIIKIILAVVIGYLTARFFPVQGEQGHHTEHNEIHNHCPDDCCRHGILFPALKHTFKSWLFILLSIIVFGFSVHYIGEDAFKSIVMSNSLFQPLIAALIGLIPGCAPSIILSELYLSSVVSFGSLTAGLISCSGAGLVFLYRSNKNINQNITITVLLFVLGSVIGTVLHLTGVSF